MSNLMTPIFRVSFPSVFKPSKKYGKYELTAIVIKEGYNGKSDRKALANLKKQCIRVGEEKWGKKKFEALRALKYFKWPFRDGTEKEHLDGYDENVEFFAMRSTDPPQVIGRNKQPIGESDFYAGCMARATVVPYAFENESQGIGLGLQNIQKVGEGKPFSPRKSAEDDFDEADDDVWTDNTVDDDDEDNEDDF